MISPGLTLAAGPRGGWPGSEKDPDTLERPWGELAWWIGMVDTRACAPMGAACSYPYMLEPEEAGLTAATEARWAGGLGTLTGAEPGARDMDRAVGEGGPIDRAEVLRMGEAGLA